MAIPMITMITMITKMSAPCPEDAPDLTRSGLLPEKSYNLRHETPSFAGRSCSCLGVDGAFLAKARARPEAFRERSAGR